MSGGGGPARAAPGRAYVLDASVVACAFLPEPAAEGAEALLFGGGALLAPDILALEVAAALTRRVRRGEVAAADARRAWATVPALAIRVSPHAPLLAAALDLSLAHRHATPDCVYLALARSEAVGLATLDRGLAALAARLSVPLWSPDDDAPAP